MKKRLVSLLLAFSMMLTFLPVGAVSAFAAVDDEFSIKTTDSTPVTLWYEVTADTETEKTVKVRGIDGSQSQSATIVTIPETVVYSGAYYDVTAIEEYAFSMKSSLKQIEIPKTVTSIGAAAFHDCTSLEEVTFAPDSQLKVIANRDGSYGYGAFQNCTSLKSIELPKTVESIGTYAFCDTGLETVTLAGTQVIGGGAFSRTKLKSIVIPSSVTTIESDAFSECEKLETVEFDKNGKLTTIGYSVFDYDNALKSVELPGGLTQISWYAFQNCENLEKVYYNGTKNDFISKVKGGYDYTFDTEITDPAHCLIKEYGYPDSEYYDILYKCNVTYKDGEETKGTETVWRHDNITSAPTLTKDGYTFKGWTADPANAYDAKTGVVLDDVTLTAVWEENKTPTNPDDNKDNTGKDDNKDDNDNTKPYTIKVVDGTVNGNTNTAKVDATDTVTLTPGEAPDGMSFQYWDIPQELMDALVANGEGKFDNKTPNLSFQMPNVKAGEYTIKAMFGTPDTVDDTDYSALGIATGVVGGTVVAGILGWQVYSLASQSYLELALPYIPTNRQELATLLWEDAGKPELTVDNYTDIDAASTEQQKAARWAVAEGLMDEADKDDERVFAPNNGVSNWTIIKAWRKAQKLKKG